MTIEISKDDQDWLDALSGKTPAEIDPLNSAQALAVRKALVARRNAIETDAINVGGSGLDEIRARLQREGLMEPATRMEGAEVPGDRVSALDSVEAV